MRSRIGRPATLIIGLGSESVMGRNRSPRPPAITTAQFGRIEAPRISRKRWSPTSFPDSSTMGICCKVRARIKSSTSVRLAEGPTAVKRRCMNLETASSKEAPERIALRISPSVSVPRSAPSGLTTRTISRDPRSRTSMAVRRDALSETTVSSKFCDIRSPSSIGSAAQVRPPRRRQARHPSRRRPPHRRWRLRRFGWTV